MRRFETIFSDWKQEALFSKIDFKSERFPIDIVSNVCFQSTNYPRFHEDNFDSLGLELLTTINTMKPITSNPIIGQGRLKNSQLFGGFNHCRRPKGIAAYTNKKCAKSELPIGFSPVDLVGYKVRSMNILLACWFWPSSCLLEIKWRKFGKYLGL